MSLAVALALALREDACLVPAIPSCRGRFLVAVAVRLRWTPGGFGGCKGKAPESKNMKL